MPGAIKDIPLTQIHSNPYRDLATYPWIEAKVEQLMRSIEEVGFWEGIIARPVGDRFETAFGHHRIEAARRLKLKTVPLILRSLSDRDMVRFMGRENGEDYNSDFLVMLNTWEGAVRFFPSIDGKKQPLEMAKLLGWTQPHTKQKTPDGYIQMTPLAAACAAAYELVRDKHMQRADMRGLTVSAAREIVVVARKDIAGLQRVSDMNHNYTETELDAAKKIVGKSAKNTADDYRKGKLAHKDLRTEVQLNVLRHARRDKPKLLPLFADFSKAVVNKIDGMLNDDRVARHIDEIVKVLPEITLEEDHATIRDIHHSLGQLTRRADKAVVRTTPSKVVKLKAITEDRP